MIGAKIRRHRELKGLTQKALGDLLGVAESTVSGWESSDKPPPSKYLSRLSQLLDISLEDLVGLAPRIEGAYPVTETVLLPVVGQAQAGAPKIAIQEYEEFKPVEKELIRGGDYIWIRVEGDSMEQAGILPGGYVLVRLQPYIEPGQIGVVDLFDDGVVIKYVHPDRDRVVLLSANPNYQPRYVHADQCRIIGLVEEYRKRMI